MSIFFNYNGKLYKEGSPVISPDNRGFRYGDGLFETMKIVHGKLLFAADHFARLLKGMSILQFQIPAHFNSLFIEKEIAELVQKNHHTEFARIRITVVRGNGGIFDAENHLPNYIIQSWPLQKNTGQLNHNGLVLGFYEDVKKNADLLGNIKHNNYLPAVLAALFAQKNKWNDAIILNHFGRVCESTIANIFIVKSEIIYTPTLQEGCVDGIFRQYLLTQFRSKDFSYTEKEITVEELLQADEIFLSNSIGNIRWVQRIGDKEFGNNFIRKIYTSLQ